MFMMRIKPSNSITYPLTGCEQSKIEYNYLIECNVQYNQMKSSFSFAQLLRILFAPSVTESLPSDQTLIVFAADTDRIQTYVFESDTLPQIRGGSIQLSELNARQKLEQLLTSQGLPKECLIYAGGGSLLGFLPDEAAAINFAHTLTQQYVQATGAATISTAYRRVSIKQVTEGLNSAGGGRFGEIVSLIGIDLRRAKQERNAPPYSEIMPFAELCPSCSIRPSVSRNGGPKQDTPICEVCRAKEQYGRGEARFYWVDTLKDDLKQAKYPLSPQVEYPQDVEVLSGGEPIALIYADGDNIGERLKKLKTPRDFDHFSKQLGQITRQAFTAALAGNPGLAPLNRDGIKVYPWELITIGGDDVVLLLPATSALKFVERFAREFAQRGRKIDPTNPIHASVGFAVGKPHTPIREFFRAAKAALRNAKRRARIIGEACIDYHDLIREGTLNEPLKLERESRLSDSRGNALLTGRPYTLSEVKNLLETVRLLQSYPRSQLYGILEQMRNGDVRAALHYRYQKARARNDERSVLEAVERQWMDTIDPVLGFPYLRRTVGDETKIISMLADTMDWL